MNNKELECVEVIQIKETIQKVGSYGDKIFVVTQSKGLKVQALIFKTNQV